MAAGHDLFRRHFLLDQTREDVVEHRIWRQAVLILLVRPQFRRWRPGDHPLRHDAAIRPQRAIRFVFIAPARQCEHIHFVDVLQDRIAARHVTVKRRVPHRHFRFVAGGQQHVAELVAQGHQQNTANTRLNVFLGSIALGMGKNARQHVLKRHHRRLDGNGIEMNPQQLGHFARVFHRHGAGKARRHHHRAHP